jgi:peptidoglycan/xylan/chitin deacetylase (PgdA/CDA1 family)
MKTMKKAIIIIGCLFSFVALAGCGATGIDDAKATVCLFFDDAWANQYEEALPVLLEHDFKATFGVITGQIGTGENFWRYMDEEELQELAGYGMEIACHTETHPHLTDGLTDAQLVDEVAKSKLYLEQLGFAVSTFIYPYYEWNDRVLQYVRDAGYSFARGGWPEEGAFRLPLADDGAIYHLPSRQITGQDMDTFKSYLEELDGDEIICLVYHFIADDGPETTSTPVANFHEQMDYLEEAGFNVVLISDKLLP